MNIEERKLKTIWGKSGTGSDTVKITIPIWWCHKMNITKENRETIVTYNYDTETIEIKKAK